MEVAGTAEADISKESFDRIKAKYRKEALKLAAESEQSGYEKGRTDAIKAAEDQLTAWKALIKSYEVAEDEVTEGKPIFLVQHVIEQVYKRMKHKFHHHPSKCTLANAKDVLLESADELMNTLPPIALITAKKGEKPPSIVQSKGVPHVPIDSSRDALERVARPVMFRVIHQPIAPKYFIRVHIPDAAEHVVKGVFVDGEYKVYKVETEIRRINYKSIDANRKGHDKERHFVLSYSFERRHRDFRSLHAQLQKAYGRLIIPELPNRPYRARNSRDNTAENRVRFRKRQFSLWLQYLSNIERMQLSTTLISFLTGLPKLSGAELSTSLSGGTASTASTLKSLNGPSEVSISTTKRSRFFPSSVSNTSAAAPSLPLPCFEEGSLKSKLDCISECFIYARSCQSLTSEKCSSLFSQQPLLYDATRKEVRETNEIDKDDSALGIFAHRQLALRDLITAERDVMQLEPVSVTATGAANDLAVVYSELGDAIEVFIDSMEKWRIREKEGSLEHMSLSTMIDASVASKIPMEQIAETVHQECCECMEFLTANCVKSARETIAKVTKSYPSHSFNSDVLLSNSSALANANEAIAAAVTVSQSWECCRRLRSSMILQQLLTSARTVASQHSTMRKVWQKAQKDLSKVSGESMNQSRQLRAGLEDQDVSLKSAIFDELQGYEENIQAIKESNERASQMQDMYVKISGGMSSLRSFRAIFSRPKLPGGVRRDPRPKPAVLDSDYVSAMPQSPAAVSNTAKSVTAGRASATKTCADDGVSARSKATKDVAQSDEIKKRKDTSGTPAVTQSAAETIANQVGGIDEFQDQRQRHNARKTASGVMRGTTHKMKTQPSSTSIPQNVFGTVPRPASSVPTPPSTESHSVSAQDISALRRAMNSDHDDQKVRVRASSAEQKETVRRSETTQVHSSNSQRGKSHSDAEQSTLPDIASGGANDLPVGWQQVVSDDGSVYYYHTITRVSRWDRPTEKVAAALDARIKKSEAEVGEAVQRRKHELENEKRLQEERDLVANQLKSKIKIVVQNWKHPAGERLPRDLGELLSTVHTVVNYIPSDAITKTHDLTVNSAPSELRKAYLKAVRHVHPDKLPDELEMEQQLLAEAVFIVLNDSFNTYTSRLDASRNF